MSGPVVDVLVPVLDRPHRVEPLIRSLAATTKYVACRAVFLTSPGDVAEQAEIRRLGAHEIEVPWPPGRGDYPRKMNHAAREAVTEFVFLAADDVAFRPGWIERLLAVQMETDACVVGTNDLGNTRVGAGTHSTHTLVHRDYLACGTIDQKGVLLHEGYWHNFCDDEFIQTARARGTFAPCREAIVEHHHPDWGKGQWDATYRRGREHFEDDRRYFNERSRLWSGERR